MSGLIAAMNVHPALLNDDGSFAGFLDLKNSIKLAINPGEPEEKNRLSRQRDDYGQIKDSVLLPGIPNVAIDFDEGDAETIGMALLGEVSTLSVASVTRTAEDFTVTALDVWLELGDRFINASGFLLTEDSAGPTLTDGVDYLVDLTMGLVKFLSSGSVSVDDVIERTYTTREITGKRVSGSTKNQLNVRLLGNGRNLANGKTVVIDIPRCTLRSGSEFDPLTGEFTVTSLSGAIVGAYYVDSLDSE